MKQQKRQYKYAVNLNNKRTSCVYKFIFLPYSVKFTFVDTAHDCILIQSTNFFILIIDIILLCYANEIFVKENDCLFLKQMKYNATNFGDCLNLYILMVVFFSF